MLNKPVLYLSHYFKAHRQEYYERLQAVRDRGDWEGWLAFFLKGLVQVSAQEIQTLLGTTFAGANQVVHRLVAVGVLVEITGQARHRRFRYEPYVRLFDGA